MCYYYIKIGFFIEIFAVFCDKKGYHINTLHTDLNVQAGGIYILTTMLPKSQK